MGVKFNLIIIIENKSQYEININKIKYEIKSKVLKKR